MDPEKERRGVSRAVNEGEWSEYQRLVLTELERHGSILGHLPETLETLREEVRDQRHALAQVQQIVTGYDFPGLLQMVRDHEKQINEWRASEVVPKSEVESLRTEVKLRAEKAITDKHEEAIRNLNFRYYAVVAGLVTALVILTGVIVKVIGGS